MRRQLQTRSRAVAAIGGVAERQIAPQSPALGEARRPAVARPEAHLSHAVGWRRATGPVTLVHRRPERARDRVKRESDRVAKATGEALLAGAIGVVAHDGRPARIPLPAEIARRPDGDVELA